MVTQSVCSFSRRPFRTFFRSFVYAVAVDPYASRPMADAAVGGVSTSPPPSYAIPNGRLGKERSQMSSPFQQLVAKKKVESLLAHSSLEKRPAYESLKMSESGLPLNMENIFSSIDSAVEKQGKRHRKEPAHTKPPSPIGSSAPGSRVACTPVLDEPAVTDATPEAAPAPDTTTVQDEDVDELPEFKGMDAPSLDDLLLTAKNLGGNSPGGFADNYDLLDKMERDYEKVKKAYVKLQKMYKVLSETDRKKMEQLRKHDAELFEKLQVEDTKMYNALKYKTHDLKAKYAKLQKEEDALIDEDTKLRVRHSAVVANENEMKARLAAMEEKNNSLIKMLATSQVAESELREEVKQLQYKLKASFVPHNVLRMVERVGPRDQSARPMDAPGTQTGSTAGNSSNSRTSTAKVGGGVPAPPPPPPPASHHRDKLLADIKQVQNILSAGRMNNFLTKRPAMYGMESHVERLRSLRKQCALVKGGEATAPQQPARVAGESTAALTDDFVERARNQPLPPSPPPAPPAVDRDGGAAVDSARESDHVPGPPKPAGPTISPELRRLRRKSSMVREVADLKDQLNKVEQFEKKRSSVKEEIEDILQGRIAVEDLNIRVLKAEAQVKPKPPPPPPSLRGKSRRSTFNMIAASAGLLHQKRAPKFQQYAPITEEEG